MPTSVTRPPVAFNSASHRVAPRVRPRVLVTTWAFICVCSAFASPTASTPAVSDNIPTVSSSGSESIAIENAGSAVEIDGKSIFRVYAPVGSITPRERAQGIEQRIIDLSRRQDVGIESIHAEERGLWTEILAGSNRIMGVTESDARAAERPRAEMAAEYTELIRLVIKQYREEHTWRRYLRGILYTLVATVSASGLIILLFLARRIIRSKINLWGARRESAPEASVFIWLRRYFGPPFTTIIRTLFWIMILGMVQAYVAVVLRFFPSTRYTSYRITNWLFSEMAAFGRRCIEYVPNLFFIGFICLVTYHLVKLSNYVFSELSSGQLNIRGFYRDWAEPTAKLVRVLMLTGAAVVAFPYLPGSNSPALKGISVFFGLLLSLGSSSAVANGIAGTILTYMRAFQIGDFVRIGNEVGEVIEKTLLVTRICTQKKEVVTIPNGTVLGGVVINYSAEAREQGVIFHTTVTIGYNAPWRQVHDLLTSAALATGEVQRDPAPFVVQTALSDFYVAYELNAYTKSPKNMQNIYSELHQNIQDKFNEAGVEINSPHYASLRNGNRTTIPDCYLPGNYKSPAFEVQTTNGAGPVETGVKHL